MRGGGRGGRGVGRGRGERGRKRREMFRGGRTEISLSPAAGIDGVFLSNGPGDPEMCGATVSHLQAYLSSDAARPLLGICMGHALLSRAIGADTYKMK